MADADERDPATPGAGVERELDELWDQARQRTGYTVALGPALDRVARAGTFHVPAVPATSRVPGGGALHAVIGKTVTRHLYDLCAQLDEFGRAVHACLAAIVDTLDDPIAPEVQGRLDDVAEQVASLTRAANAARDAAGGGAP